MGKVAIASLITCLLFGVIAGLGSYAIGITLGVMAQILAIPLFFIVGLIVGVVSVNYYMNRWYIW